jgi:hypothetical protein
VPYQRFLIPEKNHFVVSPRTLRRCLSINCVDTSEFSDRESFVLTFPSYEERCIIQPPLAPLSRINAQGFAFSVSDMDDFLSQFLVFRVYLVVDLRYLSVLHRHSVIDNLLREKLP